MALLYQWLASDMLALYFIIFIISLLVGSFLNVVIYRLPIMLKQQWQQDCVTLHQHPSPSAVTFNLCTPGSRCSHCQHALSALDNIPLLSWLMLKGRCRYCQAPIAKRYPLIELTSAVLAVVLVWRFGASPHLLGALLFTWLLICMTMIDVDHLLLPDSLTLSLLWLGLLINTHDLFISLPSAVLGAAIGYGVLWCLYWAFKLLTGKEGMGYGDFKLLAALGAWFGWQSLLPILLISSMTGAIIGLSLMASKRLTTELTLPFGPALALAGWVYLVWGEALVQRYWSLVL
ncbi:prepilin peptidase [Oceanisphaera avium]|uniref:Prepilin leader peptidase/N-methyltransferase n=1 Tax=Oceanisphaera avium TaxID=1903694 RepID=A0A1Y0CZW8_9GAMM|nr:A24 family peptidase [Oceanisphaera avium]ART80881.1 prepilin peptidase [Oceanisphaera avium]